VADVEQVEHAVGEHDPGAPLAGSIQLALKRFEIEHDASHSAS
jgi:hypothetical protein